MPKKLPPIPPKGQLQLRRHLSAPSLLAQVRQEFDRLKENRIRTLSYKLTDVLMSALAIFGLKYPSLLQFDQARNDELVKANLKNLYGVEKAPCDTQMRSILDPVEPETLKPAFITVHHTLQRQKVLEKYKYLGGYLISVDGTGQFSSSEIKCPECGSRKLRNGTEQHYHQLLAAAIVHPAKSTVLPLFPEAIIHQDGQAKNDCE
jgi:hypothetical protein